MLIGRSAEMSVIRDLLDDVLRRTSRVLVLRGQLFLSAATVTFHLSKVYRKLGIGRRAGLMLALLDAGLVAEPESLQEVSP
jgi:hypothetical protein